jgi:hypothetical protein
MDALCSCCGDPEAMLRVCAGIQGPWAMLFWHAASATLWFGRDRIGRRSLLWRLPSAAAGRDGDSGDDTLVITSTAVWWPSAGGDEGAGRAGCELDPAAVFPFEEIPPSGLYALRMSVGAAEDGYDVVWRSPTASLVRFAWREPLASRPLPVLAPVAAHDREARDAAGAWPRFTAALSLELLRRLSRSVQKRVTHLQRPALPPPFPLPANLLEHCADGTASPCDSDAGVTAHVAALQTRLAADSWDVAARSLPPVPPTAPYAPASVAVLFSGGLDSMVMAALAHVHAPAGEAIDLLNVCFARGHSSPDRVTALAGVAQLRSCYPDRAWQLVRVDETFLAVEERQAPTAALLAPRVTHMDFNIGSALWFAARGVGYVFPPAQDAADAAAAAGSAGGMKPATVAALATLAATHSSAGPADVLAAVMCGTEEGTAESAWAAAAAAAAALPWPSVDTEAPASAPAPVAGSEGAGGGGAGTSCERTPSKGKGARLPRIVCRGETRPGERCRAAAPAACPKHMCLACCSRGVPAVGSRAPPVGADDSAADSATAVGACAFHSAGAAALPAVSFASAHDGAAVAAAASPRACLVRSGAKVVLVGIGADEHMGGYARHRSKWVRAGWLALVEELDKDVGRIWKRNLGRDDRMCSDHGREVRSPYLDEDVTAFLRAVPLPAIVNPTLPPGVGDKFILRVVASMLGLASAAALVKRAIHFGSRIAKQSNVHTFGSNAAAKGDAVFRFAVHPRSAATADGAAGRDAAAGGAGSDSDGDH